MDKKRSVHVSMVDIWVKQLYEKIKEAIEAFYVFEYEELIEKNKNE